MSSNAGGGATPVGREVAYRLFAAEYDDASLSHAESDEERAPNYVITPTGARINRLFVVGTLTEVTPVNDEMVRARVVDPTGAFVVYAGQYQPDALAFLERADPPLFVAVTGKARTFQPEDSDRVYTSIRPESIATVDADTRDRWVVDAAERTEERIARYAAAAGLEERGDALAERLLEADLPEGLAKGIPLAQDHYGTTPGYLEALRTVSRDAVRVVAGERDQVGSFDLAPGDPAAGAATFADLAGTADVSLPETAGTPESVAAETATAPTGAEASTPTDDAAESESVDAPVSATTDGTAEDSLEAASSSAPGGDGLDAGPEATDAVDESTADVDADRGAGETAVVDESSDVSEDGPATAAGSTAAGEESAASVDESAEAVDGSVDAEGEVAAGMYEMDDEERAELEAEFGAEFTTGADVEEPGEAGIETPEPESEDAAGVDAGGVETDDAAGEPATASTPAAETEESGGLGDFEPTSTGLQDSDSDAETEAGAGADEPAAEETEAGALEDADESADAADESDETEETAATEADPDDADDEPTAEPAEDADVQDVAVDVMRDLDEGDGADRGAVIETVIDRTGVDEAAVEEAIADALMGGQCYEPDDDTLKPI